MFYKLDKKLFFFYFANGSSLVFGLLLYLFIISNSDENLAKLMFAYSIHLILGSLLTFGSNLYLFDSLSSKKTSKEKNFVLNKNIFFIFVILFLGLLIVTILSIFDYFFSVYQKNFNLNLYPFFFTAFLFSFNKILYFCFLGFKFFNYCYTIIIARSFFVFFIMMVLVLFTNFFFEFSILLSFLICETIIFLYCFKKIKKIISFNFNLYKKEYKDQILSSLKLFGEYIFAEIILKIDIFFSMLRFELKNISIYLIALVFIEGLMTFTVIIRNYFSSQYGILIFQKKYSAYVDQFKKYSLYSLGTAIFFIIFAVFILFLMNRYLLEINFLVFKYLAIMLIGYLIYSYFAISELMFLNKKNYLKQTFYFIFAIFTQVITILLLINNLGILSFPIAICMMYLMMSIFILIEILKISRLCNKTI